MVFWCETEEELEAQQAAHEAAQRERLKRNRQQFSGFTSFPWMTSRVAGRHQGALQLGCKLCPEWMARATSNAAMHRIAETHQDTERHAENVRLLEAVDQLAKALRVSQDRSGSMLSEGTSGHHAV